MLDTATVRSRLAKLESYLALLTEVEGVEEGVFAATPQHHLYAAYLLQRAIQCVIDIGTHVVAGLALGRIETYGDVVRLLTREGVLPPESAPRFQRMIGLRNLLIHDYLDVDFRRVHRFIRENQGDFALFAKAILHLLERERPPRDR